MFYPSFLKANFYQSSVQVLAVGGAGGVPCITASEYKARGQGWGAAGIGLCSCVEGICNGTQKYTGNDRVIFLKRT